jgi:LytS/YehU family sensor histidine kinase
LVRQVLNFSSKSLVTLDDELDITQLNIELEQLRFEHKFVFEIQYNDNLNLKTILIPPLLIQPITENAIWHGLLPLKKTRKGLLLIKINIVNELLHIVIEDNGVGRKMKKVDIGNMQESKGILITKQRIQNLNVYYHTNKADLIYDDLVDTGLNPSGTRVTIILPLNLQAK